MSNIRIFLTTVLTVVFSGMCSHAYAADDDAHIVGHVIDSATGEHLPYCVVKIKNTTTGPMTVQHLEGSGTPVDVAVKTPVFFDADLCLVYTFKILKRVTADVTAGVTNLLNSYQKDFNLGYLRDSDYIYGPSQPRSLKFSIQLSM